MSNDKLQLMFQNVMQGVTYKPHPTATVLQSADGAYFQTIGCQYQHEMYQVNCVSSSMAYVSSDVWQY